MNTNSRTNTGYTAKTSRTGYEPVITHHTDIAKVDIAVAVEVINVISSIILVGLVSK